MNKRWLITGQPAADGIAMGMAAMTSALADAADRADAGRQAHYTLDDFHRAVQETRKQLLQFQQSMQERIAESASQIFAVHLAILEDAGFISQIQKQIEDATPVPQAIRRTADEYTGIFSQSANPRIREKTDDLKDVTRRLLAKLSKQADAGMNANYQGRILITPKLLPSDLLQFAAQKAEGIILTSGGITAHISIIARSLEVPMILADAKLLADVAPGTPLLMDAHTGKIHVNPDPMVVAEYKSLLATHGMASPDERDIQPQTHTHDGHRIRLLAAIGLVSEARLAHELKADGIGLYRSEIPFLIRNDFPTEDEQHDVYRKVVEEMAGSEIIFRTLDIGGDKILRYFPSGEASNPFLGLRGIRFTFHHRKIFNTQMRALLRASHDRPLKILFPLVSSLDSFRYARDIVKGLIRELASENVPHQPNPGIGAMIELPCAVSIADELAQEADFLSIGTNDLIQYMLAVDRTNQEVADWYVPWHPAILRAIKTVVEAARRHHKPVSICGNMADNPKLIPVLIGMGVTALTIPPHRISQVQRIIKSIDTAAAGELAKRTLRAATLAEIADMLDIKWAFPK